MASKFIVKSGCSKGEFDGVILSTDLEPDDAIAISALAPKLRGVPLLCVVGEGRVDKRTMMAEMLASFGIDEGAVIVQGKQSDANFPDGVSEAYHVEGRPHKCTLNDGVRGRRRRPRRRLPRQVRNRPALLLLPHEFSQRRRSCSQRQRRRSTARSMSTSCATRSLLRAAIRSARRSSSRSNLA